jgi:Uma2 family endonuclease
MLITNATTRRWTKQEYYRLWETGFFSPQERTELIEGEIVVVTPPGPEHSKSIRKGNGHLVRLYGDSHDILVQLPLDLSQSNQPQPDFALVPVGESPDGHPTTADLVIEVSHSSLGFDTGEKLEIYARAGIAEYWVVDVANKRAIVYRDPGRLSETSSHFAFATRQVYQPDQAVQPLLIPGPACELAPFFA